MELYILHLKIIFVNTKNVPYLSHKKRGRMFNERFYLFLRSPTASSDRACRSLPALFIDFLYKEKCVGDVLLRSRIYGTDILDH